MRPVDDPTQTKKPDAYVLYCEAFAAYISGLEELVIEVSHRATGDAALTTAVAMAAQSTREDPPVLLKRPGFIKAHAECMAVE